MRKALIAAVLLVAVAAFMLASGLGRVSIAKASNAAVVINDEGCGLLDGDGNVVLATSDHAVITSNGNGVFVCKVHGVANSSGKAVHYDTNNNPFGPGLLCATPAGTTDNWTDTVSASGNATLSCHVNGS